MSDRSAAPSRLERQALKGIFALGTALSVWACSPADVTWKPSNGASALCILGTVDGTLVNVDGRTALADAAMYALPISDAAVVVRWPDGWRVSGFAKLEVLDAQGVVRARTGDNVHVVVASNNTGSPLLVDGALLACPIDPLPPG